MPDMRIAVTIIAGCLGLIIAFQAWTDQGDGGLSSSARLRAAGDAGWIVAVLYLLGAGFVYAVPGLAVVLFGLAGVTALGIAANGNGEVAGVWGIVAFGLAAMSAVGWREQRRVVRRQIVHRVIDEELVPVDAGRPTRGADPST
jgi:hypothetical protein